MSYQILSIDFRLSPAIRARIEAELDRVEGYLALRGHDAGEVKVTMGRKKSGAFTVKLGLHTRRLNVRAQGESQEFYHAVSKAFGSVVRQIKKQKKQRITERHAKRPLAAVA